MHPVVRSVLAAVAGVVAAGIVIALMEAIGHTLFPLPGHIDPVHADSLQASMDDIPPGSMLFVIAGWGLGTFFGALAAARLARRFALVHACCVGFIMMAMAVIIMTLIPHPTWFFITAIAIFPIATWLGARGGERRSGPARIST